MKSRKIWLGIGTAALVAPAAASPSPASLVERDPPVVAAPAAAPLRLAQHAAGHAAPAAAAATPGGEGEGGASGDAALPPILVFNRGLQLIRGHLLVGGELVAAGRWVEALPHFLHPSEEIYGGLRKDLATYDVPPFETALKALGQTVKAKNREAYARALVVVNERLDAADRGVKAKATGPWAYFVLETAVETLKSASEEYANALDGKRIKLPVEYQDSRGFVFEASRQVEAVSPDLAAKDPEALAAIRAAFVDLKTAWPTPMPPRAAVKDASEILADMSRVELQVGRFR